MGRPSLRVRELVISGGVPLREVRRLCGDRSLGLHDLVFPLSRVWPMGFSWSSFIAQSTMLSVCRSAGLGPSRVLCDSRPAPRDTREVFALATDDVMHFARRGGRDSHSAMAAVEREMSKVGLLKHEKKDVTGVKDGTVIG